MCKPLLFFLIAVILSLPMTAQEVTDKNKELGIRLSNLQDFGMIYKRQVNENKYIRYRIAAIGINGTFVDDFTNININLAASIGNERRKGVNEKLDFIYGPEYLFNIGFSNLTQDDSSILLGIRFGYVLGALWHLSDQFYVGIETIPGIGLNCNFMQETDPLFNVNLGFNASAVALQAVYRFSSE